uniref:WW domain-containing protein n=2 Tax=Oryza punctata TaxID=4537 RepID=A0A0E0MES3_ORYPU
MYIREIKIPYRIGSMEVQPELSLGPTSLGFGASAAKSSSSSESDGSSDDGSRKRRKHFAWEEAVSHASLELHLNDPLPLDWEQCLDLHSGRMYYLNRKTMRKSWVRPMEEHGNTLDLELNISTIPSTFHDGGGGGGKASSGGAVAEDDARSGGGGVGSLGPMVAVPCVNCHLLVMLCKSSPACPNCKFVQPSVPAMPRTPPRRLEATVKPLETLSLLH